jgi:hypothetical protein
MTWAGEKRVKKETKNVCKLCKSTTCVERATEDYVAKDMMVNCPDQRGRFREKEVAPGSRADEIVHGPIKRVGVWDCDQASCLSQLFSRPKPSMQGTRRSSRDERTARPTKRGSPFWWTARLTRSLSSLANHTSIIADQSLTNGHQKAV